MHITRHSSFPKSLELSFSLNEQGIELSCQKLKEILDLPKQRAYRIIQGSNDVNSSLYRLPKEVIFHILNLQLFEKFSICLNYEPSHSSKDLLSVRFERDITNSLIFNGLRKSHIDSIKSVFQQLNIPINSETNNDGEVTQTPQGGQIIQGNSTSFVGIRGGIESFRALFPGKTDAELQKLFG